MTTTETGNSFVDCAILRVREKTGKGAFVQEGRWRNNWIRRGRCGGLLRFRSRRPLPPVRVNRFLEVAQELNKVLREQLNSVLLIVSLLLTHFKRKYKQKISWWMEAATRKHFFRQSSNWLMPYKLYRKKKGERKAKMSCSRSMQLGNFSKSAEDCCLRKTLLQKAEKILWMFLDRLLPSKKAGTLNQSTNQTHFSQRPLYELRMQLHCVEIQESSFYSDFSWNQFVNVGVWINGQIVIFVHLDIGLKLISFHTLSRIEKFSDFHTVDE